MNEARDPTTQKILDLTLEIIYLLTGEDHMVVKIHKMVTDRNSHQTEPIHKKMNEQKILELTNQIMRLLTGEVPVRCEDVTVYLSMEEWEYVERHKELYEDVVMEDHQPVITRGTKNMTSSGENNSDRTKPTRGKSKSPIHTKQDPLVSEDRLVTEIEMYPTTEHSQTEYPYLPCDVKEEPASCDQHLTGDDVTKLTECTQTPFTAGHPIVVIKEELTVCENGNVSHMDVYKPSNDTQTEYTFTHLTAEADSSGEGNTTDPYMYSSTEHTEIKYTPVNDIAYPIEINPSKSSIESNKSNMQVECSECGKCFTQASELTKHTLIHTGERPFKCLKCGKCFSRASNLNRHKRTHIRQKQQLSCTECGKCFIRASHLAIHKVIHKGGKLFKCSECGRCFTIASTLAAHERMHTGVKPYKCPECGRCFSQNSGLTKHRMLHKGEKPYKCPECERCFSVAEHLALHIMVHTGDKPFKCTECGKSFGQANHLERHNMIHTGEKPFICSECGKGFIKVADLKRHEVVHTREKPFQCDECGKCVARASYLEIHKLTHKKEKPFMCTECGNCFIQASHLVKHKLIHTGEKPYKCANCGKCFIKAADLRRHEMVHTGEKPFTCNECGKGFTRAYLLAAHKANHIREKNLLEMLFSRKGDSCGPSY